MWNSIVLVPDHCLSSPLKACISLITPRIRNRFYLFAVLFVCCFYAFGELEVLDFLFVCKDSLVCHLLRKSCSLGFPLVLFCFMAS